MDPESKPINILKLTKTQLELFEKEKEHFKQKS